MIVEQLILVIIVIVVVVLAFLLIRRELKKKNATFWELMKLQRARLYTFMGEKKKAKQQLLDVIEKHPGSYSAHKMLADIYKDEGGMRKAIDEYVQAIEINKQDYDSYFTVAELLNSLDKQDEAAEMLTSLLHKKPEIYKASVLLGDILVQKEMY